MTDSISRWLLALSLLSLPWLTPGPAHGLQLTLDPGASRIEPPTGPAQALSGTLDLDVTLPLGTNPVALAIQSVSISAPDGTSFGLDPDVPSPGLGVLALDGSFEIFTLFLRITGGELLDLAIPDLTGNLAFGPGGSVYSLSTSFEVISAEGTSLVTIAAIPEPASAALLGIGLGALAARARRQHTRGGQRHRARQQNLEASP